MQLMCKTKHQTGEGDVDDAAGREHTDHRHMTEECHSMPNFKYSTMRDTAHRQECKQVVEKQHHPVTRQVCEEVHYMVKCRDMAGQECKHEPMENC